MERNFPEGNSISCPDESVWLHLVAETLPEKKRQELLDHASGCRACADALSSAIYILNAEEDDTIGVAAARPMDTQTRAELAGRCAEASKRRGVTRFWRVRNVLAIAATLAIVAGGVFLLERPRPPMGLLAEAYTERRNMDVRIEGAAFGPVRINRGAASAREAPAALHKAEARIQDYLQTHPTDSDWLVARGRAQLLEGNYDGAVETLRFALDLAVPEANRAETLTDLASAYYGRAPEKNPLDYQTAADLLGQAIQEDPNLALAYFNRALVYEKLFLLDAAKNDWQRYLQLDKNGAWHDEAARDLAELNAKMSSALDERGPNDLAEVQLDAAMRGKADPSTLPALAARIESESGDRWLSDILASQNSEWMARLGGLTESRDAMRIAQFAREIDGLDHAGAAPSSAFEAWAGFERLFREIHYTRPNGCSKAVAGLVQFAGARSYIWLETQALIDRSSCELLAGDLGAAQASVGQALDFAHAHHYPVLELRAAGILAAWLVQGGQYREAAKLESRYLEVFWSRSFPLGRAQQFYADMSEIAEARREWQMGVAARQMSASIAGHFGWTVTEGVNRSHAADSAAKAGMSSQAVRELARAQSLFATQPDTGAVGEYRAAAEAFSAELTHDSGSLARFRHLAETAAGPLVTVPYLRAMAGFEIEKRDYTQAERDLRAAVDHIRSHSGPLSPGQARLWRDELRRVYERLVESELDRGSADPAYRDWQEFLAEDESLQRNGPVAPLPPAPGAPASLITYARLGNRYAAWLRGPGALRFAWVSGDAAALDAEVRRFAALSARPEAEANAAAQSAGKGLRARLLDDLLTPAHGEAAVVIQPDGELDRLPWPALPTASGEPLGETTALALAPLAIPVDRQVVLPAPPMHSALLVAATSVAAEFVSDYPPLPGVDQEVAAVRAALPNVDVLNGGAATADRIQAAGAGHDILHFTGHAAESATGIRLLVAPDPHNADSDAARGLWQPAAGRTPLALAVLNACSTARSEDSGAPEPKHLAAAALLSGARQALATLWDTDSLAARSFTTAFYRELSRGQSAAAAAASARREVRQTQGYESAAYWAPFNVYVRF